MKDSFCTYHPIVNFAFYIFVIGISIFIMHPVLMAISFIGAVFYGVYIKGKRAFFNVFIFGLPVVVFSAIVNPLFSHKGATVLFYIKPQLPFTLESMVYGAFTGLMMAIVILWCTSLNEVMTSDKIVYLFGKAIPSAALILSMVLRFTPRFLEQLKKVMLAQKGIGKDFKNGNLKKRLKQGITILSIMVTWSLENSVETADSMKARGYGIKNRTNFHMFKIQKRDIILLLFMGISFLWILFCTMSGELSLEFYPVFKMNNSSFFEIAAYILYSVVCLLPVVLNIREDIKWHYLKSKI